MRMTLPPAGTRARFHVWEIHACGCALFLWLLLIGGGQVAAASEETLHVDANIGPVLTIEGEADTLWIGTALGLYSWKGAPLGAPQQVPVQVRNVRVLLLDDKTKTLWVGAEEGLFRWDNPMQGGTPQLIANSPKSVIKLQLFGTRLLVAATGGLSVLHDGSFGEPHPFDVVGPFVNSFCQDGDTKVWIGSDQGLFSWDGVGDPEPVPVGESVSVTSLYKEGGTLLVGTSKGLLRWSEAPKGSRQWLFDDAEVHSLYKDTVTLLISTKGKGLRRLDDVLTGQWRPVAQDIGTSSKYYRNGPILWMGAGAIAEAKLYRWDSRIEEMPQPVIGVNTGYVHHFYRSGDTLWIGADKGLFKLDGLDTGWNAQLEIISKIPGIIYSDYNLPIRWHIGNYGWRTTPEQVYCRIILTKDVSGKEVIVEGGEGYGHHDAILPALAPGSYTLSVQATDLSGKSSVSPPLRLQVYSSWKDIAWLVVEFYAFLNILVTLLLIFLSRWYQGALELFTWPWLQRGSLYVGFLLCYIRFVRLWVFERYYQELKQEFAEDRRYLTAEIKRPDGTTVEPDKLLGELKKHPHILIQGEPGTGKTELLKRVLKIYCAAPSLRRAFKLHGFILIMVRLRDFGGPAETGDDTTIANLARLALKAKDMLFHDKTLFARLVRRKDFLIILDGLNEADIDKQAIKFVASSPKVRVLATSQTPLSHDLIEVYQLPAMTPRFAKQLLAAFLEKGQADHVYTVTTEEFWGNIRSGYDVRLIQNAVEQKRPVPTTRLELFDATIRSAGEQYPLHILYEYAWVLWKKKERLFGEDEKLTSSLIVPLQEAKVVVARGSKREFRHDLMRGYLAACWAVREAGSVEVTISRLNEDEVWRLGVSEQNLVFPFLTDLLKAPEELQQVMQFATDDPGIRVCLLDACKRAAENKGWAFKISVHEPSPDLLSAT